MPCALSVLLLLSLCLPTYADDLDSNHTLVVNRPNIRNQTKTTRNDQLLSLLAARRREIIQRRFRTHIKNIVDISTGNTTSLPKHISTYPTTNKTIHVHLNLSDILLRNGSNTTEDNLQNVNPSTEINTVNVSAPRNAQKRKVENQKTSPIIRNILYRRKMSFLNRKLPLDIDQIGFDNFGLADKHPEDLILDNEDSLQVEESSHDKLIYYDVKNNASKMSANNFEDTSEETKTMLMNNKTKKLPSNNTFHNFENQTKISNETSIKNETKLANPKNTTKFMSPSLYNYFRPLDVPEEAEMTPFLRFGEKIQKPELKPEEEIDENMDVSIIKSQIENKIAKANVPNPKVPIVRDYFKNRTLTKKNSTEPPKVEKKVFNFRNMTRNRGFRNATIFVQNKRSGIRQTINLKGNSSIANLKPITTTEHMQSTTIPSINIPEKLQKLTTEHETIVTILPESSSTSSTTTTTTTAKTTTTSTTTTAKSTTISTTKPSTAKPSPTTSRTTPRTTSTTSRTTPTTTITTTTTRTTPTTTTTTTTTRTTPTSTETTSTIRTTKSTTTPRLTTKTTHRSTTTATTENTERSMPVTNSTESTITNPTTGLFSTAVVTSVSVESAKSRANKTEQEREQSVKMDQTLDYDVIAQLNNFTYQGFQNNTQNSTISSTTYPKINIENTTQKAVPTKERTPFILRPTTSTQKPSTDFIINVPDLESTEHVDTTIDTTTEMITTPTIQETTTTPKRVFNTTVLSKTDPELPLATLFSVTDFKKPENSTKLKIQPSETVISRKSDSEISIENVHAAYILAALGFLPMMVIVIYVIRTVMQKKNKIIEDYETEMQDNEKKSIIHPVARLPTLVDPNNKWEFPRGKLRLQTLLGQGNFGQVWKAEADDLKGHVGLTRLVAVKTIKDGSSNKEREDLLQELSIMQKMGSHPNVVTLLGCCTEKEPYLLIMEYVMYGKLLTYLRDHRTRRDYYNFSDDAATLTSRDLTVFAYCVARGMEYLSSKGIIHRDLAARNILVDHNKLCKIADYGMSRDASTSGGEITEPRGPRNALPVRWMAVESLLYNVFSTKSDVWSFGVLLWEIVTLGSSPYATISGREVMRLVCQGYRLERPAHCSAELHAVMAGCWESDPSQRPSFNALRTRLSNLLARPPPLPSLVDLESYRELPASEMDHCTPRGNYCEVRVSEFECDI